MLLIEQLCYEFLPPYYFGLEVLLSYLLKLKYALVINIQNEWGKCAQIFQKSRRHLKILGSRKGDVKQVPY